MSEAIERSWPLYSHDRRGHIICLTWERWEHALGHPGMGDNTLALVVETVRIGRRRQDKFDRTKYRYEREYANLSFDFTHVVVVVKFGWRGSPPIANNFVLTAYLAENCEKMKAIHYDADGDILTVTFDEAKDQNLTGIELSDNLVLYFNSENGQPYQLIMISYQAMLEASTREPLILDGLGNAPATTQAFVVAMLERAPLNAFLQLAEGHGNSLHASRLQAVFTPDMLQVVSAS